MSGHLWLLSHQVRCLSRMHPCTRLFLCWKILGARSINTPSDVWCNPGAGGNHRLWLCWWRCTSICAAALGPGGACRGSSFVWLTVNWKKTKIQSLWLPAFGAGSRSLWRAGKSCNDIHRSLCLHQHIWNLQKAWYGQSCHAGSRPHMGSRMALQMKVTLWHLHHTNCSIYLRTWTVTQSDSNRINAFDQWCLRRICGVRWSDHIINMEILLHTSPQLLSKIISTGSLTLFGHVARIELLRDMSHTLSEWVPRSWKCSTWRSSFTWKSTVKKDLATLNIGFHTALKEAENSEYWGRLLH